MQVLEKALNAPARPDRAMADAGRRAEIHVITSYSIHYTKLYDPA